MSSSAEEVTSCLHHTAETISTALTVCSMLVMQRPSASHRAGAGKLFGLHRCYQDADDDSQSASAKHIRCIVGDACIARVQMYAGCTYTQCLAWLCLALQHILDQADNLFAAAWKQQAWVYSGAGQTLLPAHAPPADMQCCSPPYQPPLPGHMVTF